MVFAMTCAVLGCVKKERGNAAKTIAEANLVQYVNPYIGSGGHGHVFVGANVPFGGVQLGPVNLTEGWDWCSGYHYSDSTIIGFAHTHLSGTGIGDLGDVLVMPIVGEVAVAKGKPEQPDTGYFSYFDHENETVEAGYYRVHLDRYDVNAELTATERAGFHRYTFPESEDSKLLFNLKQGIGWDVSTKTHIELVNDTTLTGYRYSKGWAKDQKLYFAAKLSKPVASFEVFDENKPKEGTSYTGKQIKALLGFSTTADEGILLKVGVSPVSTKNALENLKQEIPHWDFDKTVADAKDKWNHELNKIQVAMGDEVALTKFYTGLYHTMIAPSVFNDINGDYAGDDGKIRNDTSFTNLTTFSLWDIYRGCSPLYTIFQQDRMEDMVQSMLKIYEQQGKLPVWHLVGNETNTMPGYSAVPIVVDAYLKGIPMDPELAYKAVTTSAMRDDLGLDKVKELGYISADGEVESVSKGLEYALADWCIAQMAKELGKQEDYEYYAKRGQNYRNYFDPEVGFMRGRISEKKWREPFSPFTSVHMKGDFTEGNAWQYTWLVPQDVDGLVGLLGGKEAFAAKLDSLFMVEGDMGEEASNDITGLIGQYAQGNEPSHHVTYMYAYVDQSYKTAEKVRYILKNLYANDPDGLSGNEDVGQMSAWLVLSSLGFYPVEPAGGKYVWGSPTVNDAVIRMDNGKTLELTVNNNSPENIYIQEVTFNGKPYSKQFLMHEDIIKGGKLVVEMGNSKE
ncbi:glycoside hydrolase family 92 protein [Echinicola strongylocentroti]|uniref:Glycoside hydrolase family 92 protein n=2 Tax=Echinicola strongylocentroti TaxID=1795355 RepID=A0A2Z4IQV3_9BACT|nr:glycoside hydrolase family 92 protein [Echinicola strongylocentroti]